MFQVRDYSLFSESPNAARAFRRQHLFDLAVKSLIAILVLLCLWNVFELIQLRLITNQDLADVRSISDDPSTKLIWILTLVTVGVIGLREWMFGANTAIGILIPLSLLLGLVLVPAGMSEIQPALNDQTLRVVMNECPPKAIVNGELSSIGRCTPSQLAEGDVMLAASDPTTGDFQTLDATAGGQNTVTYTMQGRGTYTVYFMFRYDDMAACEHAHIFHRGDQFPESSGQCMEYDGNIWMVMPHTTASNLPSGIHLIEVTLP